MLQKLYADSQIAPACLGKRQGGFSERKTYLASRFGGKSVGAQYSRASGADKTHNDPPLSNISVDFPPALKRHPSNEPGRMRNQ